MVTASLAAGGCAGTPAPPNRAASRALIQRTIVDFSRLAYNGEGDGACRLATERSMPQGGQGLEGHKPSCEDFWSRFGPADPRVQAVVFDDRMSSVTIRRASAMAHMVNGDDLALVWRDGRWKLDFAPQ